MSYNIIPVSILLIGAYILSFVFYKRGFIRKVLHVRIWNILIFFSFLIVGVFGIILIAFIENGITTPISQKMLFWHVEVGIALLAISIFHIHCYWRSFRRILR
ncbi:MAG: hypothetical protein FJ150_02820 [Euryarchaeota archaeon]|nr:hypothetical protein [Euryarchaeota archaeon]